MHLQISGLYHSCTGKIPQTSFCMGQIFQMHCLVLASWQLNVSMPNPCLQMIYIIASTKTRNLRLPPMHPNRPIGKIHFSSEKKQRTTLNSFLMQNGFEDIWSLSFTMFTTQTKRFLLFLFYPFKTNTYSTQKKWKVKSFSVFLHIALLHNKNPQLDTDHNFRLTLLACDVFDAFASSWREDMVRQKAPGWCFFSFFHYHPYESHPPI